MIVDIADNLAPELAPYQDRLGELLLLGLSQVKLREALLFYEHGLISLRRAAELTGLTEQEMSRHARAAGIPPRWTEAMVDEELA